MTLATFELNDGGLRLRTGAGQEQCEPGLALAQGQDLLLGHAAAAWVRREPAKVMNEHFHRLSTDPLPQPLERARTHADLIHAQLQGLWQAGADPSGEALLAVPGTWNREQLALLLGIADACAFDAVGLVDSALLTLAGAGPLARGPHAVIDGGLHQGLVSSFAQHPEQLERTGVSPVPAAALTDLEDCWLSAIADQFVAETRFDPLHTGASEQALFDALPGWLEALSRGETPEAALTVNGQRFALTLQRGALLGKVRGRYDAFLEALSAQALPEGTLWLHERLGRFPGLAAHLSEGLGQPLQPLSGAQLWAGLEAQGQGLRGTVGALSYLTTLALPARQDGQPLETPAPALPHAPAPSLGAASEMPNALDATAAPTHVLLGWLALPLKGQATLPVGGAEGPTKTLGLPQLGHLEHSEAGWRLMPEAPARLEGVPVAGPLPLALGQTVYLGTEALPLRLIHVQAADG
ncbi:MAG: hypothetical protein ISQ02_00840 [Pseudomonadales bacterium]|nr:hypothetical protein [Pseudomonadales bacterium]